LIRGADSVDDFRRIIEPSDPLDHFSIDISLRDLVRMDLFPVRYEEELEFILKLREDYRQRKDSFLNLPSTAVNKKIEDEFNAEDEDLERRYKDLYSKFIKHVPTIDISAHDF
jgi:hypothetical protein